MLRKTKNCTKHSQTAATPSSSRVFERFRIEFFLEERQPHLVEFVPLIEWVQSDFFDFSADLM